MNTIHLCMWGMGYCRTAAQPVCLTVIRCHEGNVVVVVPDIWRLSVKNGDGGNLSVSRVNLQPVGRVIHLGVPVFGEREPA